MAGDRDVLLVDVDERDLGPVVVLVVGLGWATLDLGAGEGAQVDLELEGLVLLRDDVLGENLKGAEDWEVDLANVGAAIGDNEVLVQCGERELDGAAGLEWQGGRDEVGVLEEAVETILLTLLADDGANTWDQLLVTSITRSEVSLDILKGAKDDISEEGSGLDGALEVVGAEVVLARENCVLALASENLTGKRSVELLLSLVGSESLDDEVALGGIRDVEAAARTGAGEVPDEAVEEENLEVLVELDQLDAGDAQVADGARRRRAAVGESAMGKNLNSSELLSVEVWEAIRKRVHRGGRCGRCGGAGGLIIVGSSRSGSGAGRVAGAVGAVAGRGGDGCAKESGRCELCVHCGCCLGLIA